MKYTLTILTATMLSASAATTLINLGSADGQAIDLSSLSTGHYTLSSANGLFSAGSGGSFAPTGSVTYLGSNTAIDTWKTRTGENNSWTLLANGLNQDNTITISGLAVKSTYTVSILSARANNYGNGTDGTYALSYDNTAVTGGGTHDMGGGADGTNATIYTWTFSTGETVSDASLALSGGWNLNAIHIAETSVPEASSCALLGLAGFSFLLRRRR